MRHRYLGQLGLGFKFRVLGLGVGGRVEGFQVKSLGFLGHQKSAGHRKMVPAGS